MAEPAALVESAFQTTPALHLPEQDTVLYRDMLGGWTARRLGSQRHHPKSVSRDVNVVMAFAEHTGKAPWYWSADDFEAWCYQIGVIKKLATTTQRHYQSAVRSFLDYIVNNIRFSNEVRRVYGIQMVQICTADNCIPHVDEREVTKERRAFSREEVAELFEGIDEGIAEAAKFKTKDFRPLMRDKAMFGLMYMAGLRISETRWLDVTSFQPNETIPEFGFYGNVHVTHAKGSRGSGPKQRIVPVTHAGLPPLLVWYVDSVRPWYLRNADPNEAALFLSERGNRIGLSTMEARFQHCLELAKLDDRGFVPHCLRHSSVTHESERFSLEANRRKHGHVYGTTTQGYCHYGDEFVQEEVSRAIDKQLAELQEKPKS